MFIKTEITRMLIVEITEESTSSWTEVQELLKDTVNTYNKKKKTDVHRPPTNHK